MSLGDQFSDSTGSHEKADSSTANVEQDAVHKQDDGSDDVAAHRAQIGAG
jgi:hypothetical protein